MSNTKKVILFLSGVFVVSSAIATGTVSYKAGDSLKNHGECVKAYKSADGEKTYSMLPMKLEDLAPRGYFDMDTAIAEKTLAVAIMKVSKNSCGTPPSET